MNNKKNSRKFITLLGYKSNNYISYFDEKKQSH